ncbi:condensation domain-containing protein, partial [Azorhizobium doebereinerae]|uniref:condensation domain-containing protein n=1 Tax=Azorhizobium doebereinerae TaxID=281091 RepID=UPI00048F22EE
MTLPLHIATLSPAEKRQLLAKLLAEQTDGPREYPVSFAQERLWFFEQLHPGSAVYNIPVALRLPGSL